MKRKVIKVYNSFVTNSLLRDSAKLVSSNIVMYLLPFVVTPILTRLYDPSLFGDWGVFSSTFQIVNVILFLCYDYTIVKASNDELTESCVLSYITSLVMILLTALVFFVGSSKGISFFSDFPCKGWLFGMLLLSSITTILQNIANRWGDYWLLSASNVIVGVFQATFRIGLAYFLFFSNGLIAGSVFAQLLGVLFLFLFINRNKTYQLRFVYDFTKLRKFAIKYKKFPLYDAPATLLTFVTFNLTVIILSFYYSKAEIGCLSIVHQLLLLPISLVGSAMGRVYYQQLSKDGSSVNNSLNMKIITLKMIKMVMIISVLPILFLSLGGDFLLDVFLGSKWKGAGGVALCLSIWSLPNILTQPLVPLLRKENKQGHMLIFNLINFISAIGCLLILCNNSSNLGNCLIGYSIASSISNYMLFIYILNLTNIKLKEIGTLFWVLQVCSYSLLSVRLFFMM